LRRLHSLSGLIPVGAYMVVHLLTNASINDSVMAFQNAVYGIHSLGDVLWIVEWVFIFIPLIFHAVFGVIIIKGAVPNHNSYRYTNNFRYSMQRATGMIAFLFIMLHVFHMHGWFHFSAWLDVVKSMGGAKFAPYNAASTAAEALQTGPSPILVNIFYSIGVLASVFHLANGLWTMGITWGVLVSPLAQRRANYVCAAFGVVLACIGIGAQVGMLRVDVAEARKIENQVYEERVKAGLVKPDDHKRAIDDAIDHGGKEVATSTDP
jgi:succinate dehydrogenase / fumarate reductase cytochrome b subunit